ncbi:tight adherence pilus pseudopilin TadF [Moritella viscosa]|uniref:ATP/GTP-binding site motif A (P-loop) surface protein involved infimbraea and/or secretion, TadF-like protein n=1 Tax=Moritella viscosa TaxID=80854 RepID=A0A1K9YZY5_9GAMM|nr:tight adherence pilus pseudopilin TadF [Moritella viscosa]SGY85494.1 ATP/GTP-binding site motif A (P-loop) surface protein involved infimbraea and/or secretion, TadF-like protein [Moritella viscosa]SGY86545.1 ATP/GTP-binding site motif A (P-loop) surface protein involved infimbraea and/or secretion, TadF-like protein [Moritella viscosa]SHN99543.1 ATP/GTP-binding site motif A (P-loop) surface protein involved infimbraea and/or secretion, TadF-like protein [Moritella viscosa]
MNLNYKQKGNFTVEFAIVGVAFSFLIIFSADVIVKLSLKGKLDRLSYSVANILKERTQFQKEDYTLSDKEISTLNTIAKQSMRRTSLNFDGKRWGMRIEALQFDSKDKPVVVSFPRGTQQITPSIDMDTLTNLAVMTSWGRRASIYRVTMVYRTENWFGALIGEEFNTVSSSAIMIGR